MKNTIIEKYKGALAILVKKPILLWGLSLLSQLLMILAVIFGVLPIVSLPIVFALEAGLYVLYLKGYRGEEVASADLFTGFKKFMHVAGGMAWMYLWVFIWGLIPIAGIVFAVVKAYEYAFVPYILINEPEVGATEALKKSQTMTKGLKAKMFWSEFIVAIAFMIVALILGWLSEIRYIGGMFGLVLFVVDVVYSLFAPIFLGLIRAGFYDNANKAETPMILPELAEEVPVAEAKTVSEEAPVAEEAAEEVTEEVVEEAAEEAAEE